jgi:hypothetical protein
MVLEMSSRVKIILGGVFMKHKKQIGATAAGAAAGGINGLFGAGGGMVLIPVLSVLCHPDEDKLFPTSVAVILPVCLMTIGVTSLKQEIPWVDALPYLIGSGVGGAIAGWKGNKIPAVLLHRALGLLILWGGVRYLC